MLRYLPIPAVVILILSILDWTGKTSNAPLPLVSACAFSSAISPSLAALVIIGLLLRAKRC